MFSLDSVMQMDFKRNLLHSKLHKRLWDDATFRWVFTAKMQNFNVYSLRNKKKTKLLCVIRRLVDGWAAFLMLKPPMSIKNRNIAISIQQFKAIWVHKSLCLFLRWGSFINKVKTSFVSSRSHHITKIYEKIAQELKKNPTCRYLPSPLCLPSLELYTRKRSLSQCLKLYAIFHPAMKIDANRELCDECST